MKLSFENQGTNTFLVYEIQPEDEIDSMSLGMLTNNSISGLAPASFTQMDTTKYIKYNVSAKVSVKQLFSGPVNKKRLVGVFLGVVEAMLSAEEYMLDPNTILLDTDYIFADVSTCETELVCLPIMGIQTVHDLSMFFKNILFTTQFDQTENCDHVAQMINYLNNNPVLLLENFRDVLKKLAEGHPAVAAPVPQPVAAPAPKPVAAPAPQPVAVPAPQPAQRPVQQVAAPKTSAAVNVPPMSPAASEQKKPMPVAEDSSGAPQKEISWFYLMQHYNAENAALYKAQQDAKKNKKAAQTPAKAAPAKTVGSAPAAKAGFAIPGQVQSGFAVPGQAQPSVQPMPQMPKQPAAESQLAPQAVATPAPQPAPVSQPVAVSQSRPLNFGETTVLSAGIGETTVLSAAAEPTRTDPHLIRTKNNEKIPLNKPVFRIGKERSYVDYFISDNTAISRGHANVVNHGGEFFVVDTNSTNHTYVNGGMIQSGVETKLSHGDKVRLANEDFEFRMY